MVAASEPLKGPCLAKPVPIVSEAISRDGPPSFVMRAG
jgi:hypothetical protein